MTDAASRSDVVEWLSALVACPSVSSLTEPVGGIYGEGPLAALIAGRIEGWGGEVQIEEVKSGRPNLAARFAGRDRERTLVLEAHLDTVSVAGMAIPPFEPAVRDGKLFGRGACDTKASVAAMLLAIRRVLDADGAPPTDVLFLGACGEELEALGARHFAEHAPRPEAIIVGEPTRLAVVTCSKGAYRFAVETRGVACHSSDPSRGVNAIVKMARVVDALSGPYAEALAGRPHPALGAPTVSVGQISGGNQVNAVPDHCRIEVDRRAVPGEKQSDVDGEVVAHIDRLTRSDPQLEYEYIRRVWYPPFEQPADSALVRCAAAACRQVLGESRIEGVQYASDAGVYAAAGIDCVLLGPGDIAQAHTVDEFVEVAQVTAAVDVYAAIIRSF